MKKQTIFVEPQNRTTQQQKADPTPFEMYEAEQQPENRDEIDYEFFED